jgi:type IV pilus assembly protein PilM
MSQKKSLIVNLAASHVSISAFRAEAGKLILEQFFTRDLAPGLADDDWLNEAVTAVSYLVSANKISGRVTIIAPSFLLLQKTLKVPQVEPERQAQIVAFEAQNNIPYPLNEVIWDSQVISSDGVEAEILLFALRTEVASKIAHSIAATGLRPLSIQAAPLLDAQAAQLAGLAQEEESLIVNVGARSTGLSFIGPAGSTIQTANIGGNLLTQGVSDNTGQAFLNAEALKIGYFNGVIHLPESDPQIAILQANVQSFIRRLSQEINRRLINIRRGAGARQPTRILLTGRGSRVPGLSEHLTESLRLPVEDFNPAPAVKIDAGVNPQYIQQHLLQISEVIGEAARLVLPKATGVNLIPRDIAAQMVFDARKPLLILASVLVAISPLPICHAYYSANRYNEEQMAKVKVKADDLLSHQRELKTTRESANSVWEVNKKLEFVFDQSPNWVNFLVDLQDRIKASPDTWVEDIRVKREQAVATPVLDGEVAPPAPPSVTKVIVTARILLNKIPPGRPFNAQEFNEREVALVESLKRSPFVADIPSDEIKPEYSEPNIPRVTFTLVIKQEKAL